MSSFSPRPTSLHAVSARAAAGSDYVAALKEFADEMSLAVRRIGHDWVFPQAAFERPPVRLRDPVLMAHLGGLAEHMAQAGGQAPPEWCGRPEHFLAEPTVLAGPRARALTMAETPSAMRRRNLFCGRVLARVYDGR